MAFWPSEYIFLGDLTILSSEVIAFGPGYDAKGSYAWFLWTHHQKITITEEDYESIRREVLHLTRPAQTHKRIKKEPNPTP